MKDNDFDPPVSVRKRFRRAIGQLFLIFSTLFGLWAMQSLGAILRGDSQIFRGGTYYHPHLSFLTEMVCIIIFSYIGFWLIVVSDNNRLLNRAASFAGAFLFMGGAIAILTIKNDSWGALPLLISALFFRGCSRLVEMLIYGNEVKSL